MVSIATKAHIGKDGRLCVEVPTAFRETDVDVVVVLQPRNGSADADALPDGVDRGWPPGFFEATAGKWQGELVREPQGEYVTHNVREFVQVPDLQVQDWQA